MSSLRKLQSARANGAKSRGPVTPEGRARSAQASVRHGLLAESMVLNNEFREGFLELLREHLDIFQPANSIESHQVEDMTVARWNLDRCATILTATLNMRMAKQAGSFAPEAQLADEACRAANAFAVEADNSKALALLLRYQTAHRRAYDKALQNLRTLQAERVKTEIEEIQADPQETPEEKPNPETGQTAQPTPESPKTAQNNADFPKTDRITTEPNPNIEHRPPDSVRCSCGLNIPLSFLRSGFRCRCGEFHKARPV